MHTVTILKNGLPKYLSHYKHSKNCKCNFTEVEITHIL